MNCETGIAVVADHEPLQIISSDNLIFCFDSFLILFSGLVYYIQR